MVTDRDDLSREIVDPTVWIFEVRDSFRVYWTRVFFAVLHE